MEGYELGFLSGEFEKHHVEAVKSHDEMIVSWKNEFSSDNLPEHLKNDFSLPKALKSLTDEIIRLNEKLDKLLERERVRDDDLLRNFLNVTGITLNPDEVDG